MKVLIWGRGIDYSILMKCVVWKSEVEIVGFIESKKTSKVCTYKGKELLIYEPKEIKEIEYDFIIIANGYFSECKLMLEINNISLGKVIVPYDNHIIKDKTAIIVGCKKCMENAEEVVKALNKQHNYMEKKRVLLYGDGRYLWQFLSVSFGKLGTDIIGVITTTHSIQGYIKIFGKETKVFEECELNNIDFDMILILDQNAVSIFAELSQSIDKDKIMIPFMTGIEENEYELIVKLSSYFSYVVHTTSAMSAFHVSKEQLIHMSYDMLNYTLFNGDEYKKLGDLHYALGAGMSDYARIRTWELLIDEIKTKNIEGEVAELGVFQGDSSKILKYYFPDRQLYLYDTFEGFDKRDYENEIKEKNFVEGWMQMYKETSLEKVQRFIGSEKNIHYRKGYFPESICDEEKQKKFSFVSLDADMYAPTLAGLRFFYPRLEKGGYIVIHEYNATIIYEGIAQNLSGVKKAVKDFENEYGNIQYVPIADRNGTLVITK